MEYETKNNITLGDFPTLDPEEWRTDTGVPEFHSVQTIELGQLVESRIFTWGRCYWGDVAYSPEQYARVCQAFEDRFWLREIGITPVGAWMRKLRYTLRVELCPKYNPLYAQIEAGEYDPLQNGGKYGKKRDISSDFPETLLNGSEEVYASSGTDAEYEEIGRDGALTENAMLYAAEFRSVDAMMLDELERLFSCLYTTNVNAL